MRFADRLRARAPRRAPCVLLLVAVALDLAGCGCRTAPRPVPVAPAASALMADARAHERAGDRERARAVARRAAELAPDWVAPERLLDELARAELCGPEALAQRLRELDLRSADGRALYLAGRLEGAAGADRMALAVRTDPDLAWGWHGLAWTRAQAGHPADALGPERRALERARDPWERAFFATAVATHLLALERVDGAVEVLARAAADAELAAPDRAELGAALALAELASGEAPVRERGFQRGLGLLRSPALPALRAGELAAALAVHGRLERGEALAALASTLAARGDPALASLRVALYLEEGRPAIALALHAALAEAPDAEALSAPALRAARFALGEGRAAIDEWVARLPRVAVGDEGLPGDPALRRVVRAARAGEGVEDLRELGLALLAAGWFREARGLASRLAPLDPAGALALDARGAAGAALLGGIARLLARVDARETFVAPWLPDDADSGAQREARGEPGARSVENLTELLAALQGLFDRFRAEAGGPWHDLGRSPLLRYGFVGSVVHPGPRFSALDAELGLGAEGDPVPGLAAAFAALGRFALFGEAPLAGGPDGTVLRRLAIEERRGEHLGVPFSGTVAWCEGADLPSRPARQGAGIAGAALHEGYWIDVGEIRSELAAWRALERELVRPRGGAAARAALAVVGPRLGAGADRHPGDRARLYAPLGEGQRIRLAVLCERAATREERGSEDLVGLDELLETVAAHEEGHLTDRTRFLPLAEHPLRAAALLLRTGFSPARIAEELEYRAQLVSLCVVRDPRLALASTVDAADLLAASAASIPHPPAYRRLLADVLLELDRRLVRDPAAHPVLDRERYLVHQLHRLSPGEVRRIALDLARRRGLR